MSDGRSGSMARMGFVVPCGFAYWGRGASGILRFAEPMVLTAPHRLSVHPDLFPEATLRRVS